MFDCTNNNLGNGVCPRAFAIATPKKNGSAVVDPSPKAFNLFDYFQFNTTTTFDSSYINPIVGSAEFGPFPSNMLPRGYFYGPGAYSADLGIYKTTKITERFSLQLRGEFFNVLNHSNLYVTQSDNDISSITDSKSLIATVHAQKGVRPNNPSDPNERRNIQLALKLIF